jgi:CheY-like chemotaxis protein
MGGKLLLADDSITIQKVVELTFAETSHQVVAVGGGRELLRRLGEVKPDCVLCDVIMPDMSGYDVCQTIKSDPATLHIPVVLLTGTFEPFDRDRALAVGCDAIVTKPFESRELVGAVEDLLVRAKAFGAGAPMPGAEGGESAAGSGIPAGVEALEFTTTGLDSLMKHIGPASPPAHEDIVIEPLELGDSHPAAPAPVPPEFREPVPTPETDDFIFSPPRGVATGLGRTGIHNPPPPVPATAEEKDVFATTPTPVAPTARAATPVREEVFLEDASEPAEPEPSRPGATAPAAAPLMADVAPVALPPEALEHIGARISEALGRPPAAPGAASAAPHELSAAEAEQVARKLLELYTPQLERIAWEIIPEVAEMLVRKRIAELEETVDEQT